ncbi:MAG: hypothetical protein JSS54_15300 [Proteobacteria bacterium]|nr:hypothetical protein [Pseudomonadota bacterium]
MTFIALAPTFSTRSALGDVAEVKVAIVFAENAVIHAQSGMRAGRVGGTLAVRW